MIWFIIPAFAIVFLGGLLFGKMLAERDIKGADVQKTLQEAFSSDQPEFYALLVANKRTADISVSKHRIRAKGLEILDKDNSAVVEMVTYKPSRREYIK